MGKLVDAAEVAAISDQLGVYLKNARCFALRAASGLSRAQRYAREMRPHAPARALRAHM